MGRKKPKNRNIASAAAARPTGGTGTPPPPDVLIARDVLLDLSCNPPSISPTAPPDVKDAMETLYKISGNASDQTANEFLPINSPAPSRIFARRLQVEFLYTNAFLTGEWNLYPEIIRLYNEALDVTDPIDPLEESNMSDEKLLQLNIPETRIEHALQCIRYLRDNATNCAKNPVSMKSSTLSTISFLSGQNYSHLLPTSNSNSPSLIQLFTLGTDAKFRHYDALLTECISRRAIREGQRVHAHMIKAKGLKRTMITSKIPATKRSMERFLFHVKALLHNTSSGCTFWMEDYSEDFQLQETKKIPLILDSEKKTFILDIPNCGDPQTLVEWLYVGWSDDLHKIIWNRMLAKSRQILEKIQVEFSFWCRLCEEKQQHYDAFHNLEILGLEDLKRRREELDGKEGSNSVELVTISEIL